jgi:flagellar biosynthesis protein FlhG
MTPRHPGDTHRSHKITVASGKGGVGKTNIATNLAILLAGYGKKVLLFDADMGLASVDTLLNLSPERTIENVVRQECDIADVAADGPRNIKILPAAPGISEMCNLSDETYNRLRRQLNAYFVNFDYVIIDAPPGIDLNVQRLLSFADEVLLVTTPEPTSVIDAYAMAKLLSTRNAALPVRLVLNMLAACDVPERVSAGFHKVVERFLGRRIETVGRLPLDAHVGMAIRRQQPFTLCYPDCPSTQSMRAMTLNLLHNTASYGKLDAAVEPLAAPMNIGNFFSGRNRLSSWVDPKVG